MKGLENKEAKEARRYDSVMRAKSYTDVVYGGGKVQNAGQKLQEIVESYRPEPSRYHIYFGEMHGHTDLSDAAPDIDTYFRVARDLAGLDFCAISDHDHGGIFSDELWGEKWDLTRRKVKEYAQQGKFLPILAYERDSYPWYDNLVIYFNSYDQNIPLGSIPGEITKAELNELLKREDLLVIPHTTSFLHSGCDFERISDELMTPLIEVYSRWGTDEYFGNPNPVRIECRGGFWQDALQKGAKMGCVCGSDDHQKMPGMMMRQEDHPNLIYPFPGLTAILAEDLTLESIFSALKARRCYGFMGGRIWIDFRINGHYMGEEFFLSPDGERFVYFSVEADCPIQCVTVVKNNENYMRFQGVPNHNKSNKLEDSFIDYNAATECDFYYLRIELTDGRFAWTSPIWLTDKAN